MKKCVKIDKWCDCRNDTERLLAAVYMHTYFNRGQFPDDDNLFKRKLQYLHSEKLCEQDFHKFDEGVALTNISSYYEVDIIVWSQVRKNKGVRFYVAYSITTGQILGHNQIIHVLAPHFKHTSNFRDLKLVTNVDFYAKRGDQVRFWDHLAAFFGGKTSADALMRQWGSSSVSLENEKAFYKVFNVGFSIFKVEKSYAKTINGRMAKTTKIKDLYTSKYDNCIKLKLESGSSLMGFIKPYQSFVECEKYMFDAYICGNKHCLFVSGKRDKYERHVKTCTGETIWRYEQKLLNADSIHQFLVKCGYIPESYFLDGFSTFDIECLGAKQSKDDDDDDDQAATTIKNLQHAVSIAIHDSFSKRQPKFLLRTDNTKQGLEKLVSEFFAYLTELQVLHEENMPEWFQQNLMAITLKIRGLKLLRKRENLYNQKITSNIMSERRECTSLLKTLFKPCELILLKREYRKMPAEIINKYTSGRNYMEKMKSLRVIGYNSERYDLPILVPALVQVIGGQTTDFQTIKRGTGYMSLKVNSLCFIDAKVRRKLTFASNIIYLIRTSLPVVHLTNLPKLGKYQS